MEFVHKFYFQNYGIVNGDETKEERPWWVIKFPQLDGIFKPEWPVQTPDAIPQTDQIVQPPVNIDQSEPPAPIANPESPISNRF